MGGFDGPAEYARMGWCGQRQAEGRGIGTAGTGRGWKDKSLHMIGPGPGGLGQKGRGTARPQKGGSTVRKQKVRREEGAQTGG